MKTPIVHSAASGMVLALVSLGFVAGLATVGVARAQPAAAAEPSPGPFGLVIQFFEEGGAAFQNHLKRARTRFDELDEQARETGKGAVDAVSRLPNTRVLRGRERCLVAGNGAPDCIAAAEKLCRERGFSTGRSVDFTEAETCPPSAWASGRLERTACTTTTFITRAVCQ